MRDESAPGLFDEPPAMARPPGRDDLGGSRHPVAAIAGTEIDFEHPSAPRVAAAAIFQLAELDARRDALAAVPASFRDMVKLMVERAFYNQKRERDAKLIPGGGERAAR